MLELPTNNNSYYEQIEDLEEGELPAMNLEKMPIELPKSAATEQQEKQPLAPLVTFDLTSTAVDDEMSRLVQESVFTLNVDNDNKTMTPPSMFPLYFD